MVPEQDPAAAEPAAPADAVRPTVTVDLDWRSVVWTLAALAVLGFSVAMVVKASTAVVVLVVALFAALALDPLVGVIERRGLTRGWAVTITLVVVALAVAGFAALAGPGLVKETAGLRTQLPKTAGSLVDLPMVGHYFKDWNAPQRITEFLDTLPKRIEASDANLTGFAKGVGFGTGIFGLGLLMMLGILFDGPRVVTAARRAFPVERRDHADAVGRIVYDVIARYFAGSLLIAIINGIWVAVFALIAGVPLGPVLGVWAALTSLIPQIGGLLGFVVVVAVSLTAGLVPTFIMVLAFLFIMVTTNHVLQPTIVGKAVSLSAPVTMLSTIVGLTVAGLPGALFAVPTTGAVKAVGQYFRGIEPEMREPRVTLVHRLRERRARRSASAPQESAVDSGDPADS